MKTDLSGAKGSNAGDDFHVLWALHHAMRVLVPSSDLTAVTVEGIPIEAGLDAATAAPDAWEGVDVGLFYGGDSLSTAQRIEIQQLKYSTASPNRSWTVARLCHVTNRQGDNSVVARLAKAFIEARRLAPNLSENGLVVKLVSNQPVSEEVVHALAGVPLIANAPTFSKSEELYDRLKIASGLSDDDFSAMAKALDFTDCQGPSRFQVQERVIAAIGAVAAADSRQMMLELRQVVYSRMLPGKHDAITREVILGAMFLGDPEALLPCPSRLKQPEKIVARSVVQELVHTHFPSQQRICLHGEGGCGKTTALLEMRTQLPEGSELIIFDCYGGGRYMDSDGQRHLPRHAILHLCNEMSACVGASMLITASAAIDYPREFIIRLRKAASIVTARSPDALLVIAVDAADNSVAAALARTPPERSFVHDIAELGNLPTNVRLLISARTGRLPALRLPTGFLPVSIGDFELPETREFVRLQGIKQTDSWLEDLQHLSGGNARVISYAFDYGREMSQDPLKYLRPGGKDLQRIFQERIAEALQKGGDLLEFSRLCAALVALPRPIPLSHLAGILGVGEAHLRDIGNDLAPGLWEDSGHFGFTDEDFESFVFGHSSTALAEVRKQASSYLREHHLRDSYCAEHVAVVMHAAGDLQALLELTQAHPEPKAIKDPVRRREVQLHRLKLAMRVAREHSQTVDAVLVMLRGAKALKTDAAVQKMLTENVDLSASYAQASLRRTVLSDPKFAGLQGRVLCHLMLDSAKKGDAVRMRDWHRQFLAWLSIYFERREENASTDKWKLDWKDLAAEGEAVLRVAGAEAGLAALLRWKPRRLMPPAVLSICHHLLASGKSALVEAALGHLSHRPIWDIFIRVPLAIAGGPLDQDALSVNIGRWIRRGWLTPEAASRELGATGSNSGVCRTLITAAEIVASRAGMLDGARAVLELFATPSLRREDKIFPSSHELVDATMRAHALLECAAGREATLATYIQRVHEEAAPANESAQREEKRWREERTKRLENFVEATLPIYKARAKFILASSSDRASAQAKFEEVLKRYGSADFRQSDDHNVQSMRQLLAESTAELAHLPGVFASDITQLTFANARAGFSAQMLEAARTLSMNLDAHAAILDKVVNRARAIRTEREPATDRADQLIALARLLSPISPRDAESLFAEASEVLDGVDYDSVFHLEMLEEFAKTAASALEPIARRELACQLESVTSDVWGYLGDADRFPWESIARALTVLDPTIALAAFSRWDDEGHVRLDRVAPEFIAMALAAKSMDSAAAVPILCLTSELDSNTLDPIGVRLVDEPPSIRAFVVEELVRLALLNLDGNNGISELRGAVDLAAPRQSTPWTVQGRSVLSFFYGPDVVCVETQDMGLSTLQDDSQRDVDIRAAVVGCGRTFSTVADIEATFREIAARAGTNKTYFDTSAFMREMRTVVRHADRRAHLEALEGSNLKSRFDQADAIILAAIQWVPLSPSVATWCKDRLPALIVERLEFLYQPRIREEASLPELLAISGLGNEEIVASLLDAIGANPEKWDSGGLYSLLGLLARYLSPNEAALVLTRDLQTESSAVDAKLIPISAEDVPLSIEECLGRMLYAFMGDIELRKRWAAAHGLRAAARLGLQRVVDTAFAQWDRRCERSFRNSTAPAYWLASRLWLMVSAARIAGESPRALSGHGQMLFKVATDAEFPHLLCRQFAKDAVETLHRHGVFTLDSAAAPILAGVNQPGVSPVKIPRGYRKGFDRFHSSDQRRFHFDSMDTLPYWYERVLMLFADVKADEFLDIAEAWIIDAWQADSQVWMWDSEPRKSKFASERLSSSNRQGSLPSVERFSTHLEWHAMWCALGQLMVVRPLVKVEGGEYGSLAYWMSRFKLTSPPVWLSDLRAVKPLEARLWHSARQSDQSWFEDVTVDMLLEEIGPSTGSGEVVVSGHLTGREGDRRWTVSVSSALVAGKAASALLRSLQGIRTSWDYNIPDEGGNMEIHAGDFKLSGWLIHPEGDTALDDDDTYRRDVRRLSVCPGKDVSKRLALQTPEGEMQLWLGSTEAVHFRHVTWSDAMDDISLRSDSGFPRSEGYRLTASTEAIRQYLAAKKMDLLFEVNIARRTKENSYDNDDSKDPSEAEYDLVVIFRRDGAIEGAQGRIGTWSVPGQRAGS